MELYLIVNSSSWIIIDYQKNGFWIEKLTIGIEKFRIVNGIEVSYKNKIHKLIHPFTTLTFTCDVNNILEPKWYMSDHPTMATKVSV